MKKKQLLAAVSALFLTGGGAAWAADGHVLNEWLFEDFEGSTYWHPSDNQSFWNNVLGSSATTADGTLLIQRAIGETHTTYVPNHYLDEPVLWLVADLTGWAFSTKQGGLNEDMRFAFSHTNDSDDYESILQYAEIWLGRRASFEEVFIQGEAHSRSEGDAEWIPPVPTGLTNEEDRPVRVVMKVDRSEEGNYHYSVYYNIDDEGYVHVGTAPLDEDREPNYVRFRALNSFADQMDPDDPESPMEFAEVDRIAILNEDPIGDNIIDPPSVEPAPAEILHEWNFDEPEGTSLSGTTSSVGDTQWQTYSHDPADDLSDSFTTGDGAFRIQRAPGGNTTNLAYIPRQWAGNLYLVYDFRGWNLVGTAIEFMQFDFIDNYTTGPWTTAGFRLFRDEDTPESVFLGGRAFSGLAGAETIADEAIFPAEQTEPVRIVVEYNLDDLMYGVYYRIADGEYQLLGEAPTDPNRGPNALRFHATNSFAEEGEFVDVERVFVTGQNPMVDIDLPEAAKLIALGRNEAGHFEVRVQGEPNTNYVIEAATDLEGWEPVGSVETDGNGIFDFTDEDSEALDRRFYRAQAE